MPEIEEWRKRPIVIRMLEWDGSNEGQLAEFAGGGFHAVDPCDRIEDPEITGEVWDKLHGTWVGVKTGQCVVEGVLGEHYPLDPEARKASFDRARRLDVDPGNWQAVGRNGHGEITVAAPDAVLTRDQALIHAAWIVEIAGGAAEFADYLDAIRRSS